MMMVLVLSIHPFYGHHEIYVDRTAGRHAAGTNAKLAQPYAGTLLYQFTVTISTPNPKRTGRG